MDKKELAQLKTLEPVLIRKHVWERSKNEPWWGEHCKYCSASVGIGTGTDNIGECTLRFDEDKFKDFIEFKNYSIAPIDITDPRRTKKYFKRFTALSISEQDLIIYFCKILGIKGVTSKIKLIQSLRK